MDDAARIETYKQWLRVKYGGATPNVVALRALIEQLAKEAEESVVITSHNFEGGQAAGQIVLEPMAKLNAALAVLAEIDPDNTPTPPPMMRWADFRFLPQQR